MKSVDQRPVKLSSEEIRVPDVAYPTVVLWIAALIVWTVSTKHAVENGVNRFALQPVLNAVCVFILFTPMHDAAHRSVSRQFRWLNELVGHVCSLFFAAPFSLFRHLHLQHHKYTNDPKLDPDYWSGNPAPGALFQPFRWLTQDLHYYSTVVTNFSSYSTTLKILLIIELSIVVALQYSFGNKFGFRHWLLLIEVPKRMAIFFLAYTFDYLPHRPHVETRQSNMMAATGKLGGLFSTNEDGAGAEWADYVLLYQSLHNVHHFWPQIPFYRYKIVWQAHREEFVKHGTPIYSVFDSSSSKVQQKNL
jgi:beta-carotene hydroxylase